RLNFQIPQAASKLRGFRARVFGFDPAEHLKTPVAELRDCFEGLLELAVGPGNGRVAHRVRKRLRRSIVRARRSKPRKTHRACLLQELPSVEFIHVKSTVATEDSLVDLC